MSIRPSSITSSYPLAEVLAEQGLRALPRPGTPLERLMKYSIVKYDPTFPLETYAGDIVRATTVPVGEPGASNIDGTTAHSSLMDELVITLSKAVKRHLVLARKVVKPLVTEFYEKVSADLENAEVPSPGSAFEIQALELPSCTDDTAYMAQFLPFQDKVFLLNDKDTLHIGKCNMEFIHHLLRDGYIGVENSIKTLVASLPSDYLVKLWDGFFTFNDTPGAITPSSVTIMNSYERLYVGILLYQMCKNLYDESDVELGNYTLAEFKNKLTGIADYAGGLIINNLNRINLLDSTGIMVLSIRRDKKLCVVSGKLYHEWLSKDNSPEVLFGLIVSNSDAMNVNAINNMKDKLLQEWKLYYNLNLSRHMTDKLNVFKRILVERFYMEMKNATEEENIYRESHPKANEIVKHRLNELIDGLKNSDMADLFTVSLKLIAQCRFYYTSAFDILYGVKKALDDNPELDVREAALISTIEYIGDYIADQIDRTV
jgi:hypothetical protein